MTTQLIERPASLDAKVIEQVLLGGDLSKLTTEQRLSYYHRTCESLGLNPLTKPFDYLTLNGKTILYARKDATEQLRKIHNISVTIKAREVMEGCYVVTAQARMISDGDGRTGREDESIGAVPIDGLKGEQRSNAMMKAETKAKRRVTLSICGLGMLDEAEIESIPNAQVGEPQGPAIAQDASWKVTAAQKKARPKVEDGVFFIDGIVPRSKGNSEWAELTMSNGQKYIANAPQLITLAYNVAQDNEPVLLSLHVNGKGNQQLDTISRWKPTELVMSVVTPELKAEDIAF